MIANIRFISESDYQGVLEVYAPYVLHTAVTFDYDVPSLEDFSLRLSGISQRYPVLVCELDGQVAAYCYGGVHRAKMAYQWSVESTIYISEAYQGKGLGHIMYTALFDILRIQGFINVYAGVSVPKAQSEHFHLKYGFKPVGIFEKIGYKFGKWHDLSWFEYRLAEHTDVPALPIPITEIKEREDVLAILGNETDQLSKALLLSS